MADCINILDADWIAISISTSFLSIEFYYKLKYRISLYTINEFGQGPRKRQDG